MYLEKRKKLCKTIKIISRYSNNFAKDDSCNYDL